MYKLLWRDARRPRQRTTQHGPRCRLASPSLFASSFSFSLTCLVKRAPSQVTLTFVCTCRLAAFSVLEIALKRKGQLIKHDVSPLTRPLV